MSDNQVVFKLFQMRIFMILLSIMSTDGCKTDNDCRQPDMYCYDSGVCVSCTNCPTYQRNNGTYCAKNQNQCGDCLPGFIDSRENIDGSLSPCIPVQSNQRTDNTDLSNNNNIILYCTIIPTVILFLVSLGIIFYKKCYRPKTNLSLPPSYRDLTCPSAPPFKANPLYDNENIYTRNSLVYCEENNTQQANMYKPPDYVRYNSNNNVTNDALPENEHEPANAENENEQLLPNDHILIDEETQPSPWVPGPINNQMETLPSNFENLFTNTTNDSSSSQPQGQSGSGSSQQDCSSMNQNVVITLLVNMNQNNVQTTPNENQNEIEK